MADLTQVAVELAEREMLPEWNEAEVILCPCEFVRESIARCGGPVEKCVVVPYGVDISDPSPGIPVQKPESKNRPLRVLTVGAVGLRKGSSLCDGIGKVNR